MAAVRFNVRRDETIIVGYGLGRGDRRKNSLWSSLRRSLSIGRNSPLALCAVFKLSAHD